MSLLELLKAGDVDAFNGKRGQRSAPDLFAEDLSNLKLAGVDFSGANLEKADLSGTDLTGAILFKARLAGADLSNTVLKDVVAIRSNWREAYLEEVVLDGGDFTSADFTEAEMIGVSAADATFRSARLRRVQAKGAVFDRADLQEAKLSEANFAGAHLTGANLVEAKLVGALFTGAHLDGADLSRARGSGADFTGAELTGARMLSADMTNAKMDRADLSGADLTRADLAGVTMEEAVLTGCVLTEARLDGQEPEALEARGAVVGGAAGSAWPDQPAEYHFEDVSAAVSGDRLGVLWENDEDGENMVMRAAVVGLGEEFSGDAPALATPTDLTLARALVGAPVGFTAVTLVERPGGVMLELTDISPQGDVGATRTSRMEYRPAVRPVVVSDQGGFMLYGLGRDGPTLFVHRYNGESLELVHGERVTSARGFVGWREPALVTKGGVVRAVKTDSVGKPMAIPESFPGRTAAACHAGGPLWLAWTPRGENGFRWSALTPGEEAVVGRVVPKSGVTALDMTSVGDDALVIFAREEGGTGAAGVWASRLSPDGTTHEFPVLVDDVIDVEELRVMRVVGETVHLIATTITEDLLLLEIAGKKTRVLSQLP